MTQVTLKTKKCTAEAKVGVWQRSCAYALGTSARLKTQACKIYKWPLIMPAKKYLSTITNICSF